MGIDAPCRVALLWQGAVEGRQRDAAQVPHRALTGRARHQLLHTACAAAGRVALRLSGEHQ